MSQHNESAPPSSGACANCGTTAAGAYCHGCGQRIETHRLTLPHLLHEIPHAVFHVDRGFLVTILALARHPGRTIRGYLDGHRVRYFNPLTLLMILAGLCALAYAKFEFDFTPMGAKMPADAAATYNASMKTLFQNYSLGLVVQLPLIALTSWLIMGRHRSYGEHLAINAFIFAFMCVINLVLIPVHMLVNGSPLFLPLMLATALFFLVYQVIALWDTFRTPGHGVGTLLRALATSIGYFVVLGIISLAIGIGIALAGKAIG
jgi:hypothetical protein